MSATPSQMRSLLQPQTNDPIALRSQTHWWRSCAELVQRQPGYVEIDIRSRIGAGRLRSYLEPVIQSVRDSSVTTRINVTSRSSRWPVGVRMLPLLQQDLCLFNQCLVRAISSLLVFLNGGRPTFCCRGSRTFF